MKKILLIIALTVAALGTNAQSCYWVFLTDKGHGMVRQLEDVPARVGSCLRLSPEEAGLFHVKLSQWETARHASFPAVLILIGGNDCYIAMCHRCWRNAIREHRKIKLHRH